MKAQIEASIAALEAQLQAEREKLANFVSNVPAEFHSLTQEMFDKIKAFFA